LNVGFGENLFGRLFDSLDMENIEYSEWVPAGALVKGLFLMVSLIIVVVTSAVFFFSEELLSEDILGASVAWMVLAFLLLVFWNHGGIRAIRQKVLLAQRYYRLQNNQSVWQILGSRRQGWT
jgi:hypothetical protein